VQLLEHPASGVAHALNHGVAASGGQLLAFIDADDRWPPGKLARQRELLAERPELDAVFGHAVHFATTAAGQEVSQPAVPAYSRGTMLIRRAAFTRVGPFSTQWRLGEFIDWWARAIDAGVTSVMLPDTFLLRRVHETNLGVLRRDEQTEYARVLKAVLDRRRLTE
jgi:glycosyltransferase involved in cell wall biosynthesis